MSYTYKFIIKDKKFEGYRKIAALLFLINAVTFIVLALRATIFSAKLILFTSAFLLLGYAVYNWKYKQKKEKSYIFFYLLIAIAWMVNTPFWYFGIVFLLLLFLQLRVENDFSISLSVEQVIISGFVRKEHLWTDFNNIILKDDLLTLDFTNNKILQVQPDWTESETAPGKRAGTGAEDYTVLEKEFNDFCRQQLRKAGPHDNKPNKESPLGIPGDFIDSIDT